MFTSFDNDLLNSHGISIETAKSQIELLKKGVPYVKLVRPCVVNDGVRLLSRDKVIQCLDEARDAIDRYEVMKFVPASGAATRMFKSLYAALDEGLNDEAKKFIQNLPKFAFFDQLSDRWLSMGRSMAELRDESNWKDVIRLVLDNQGLGYGDAPKALIEFHSYPKDTMSRTRKSCEEHLSEAAQYAVNEDGVAQIHFTASSNYLPGLMNFMESASGKFEDRHQVSYDLSYSIQEPHTNTLALNSDDEPFRKDDGSLLFRPGGHGALLENLNKLDADVVFIKNIDNVCHTSQQEPTNHWKRVLLGYLVDLVNRTHKHIKELKAGEQSAEHLNIIKQYMHGRLWIDLNGDESIEELVALMNRPIRVCGMVKNQGEPGGGPFWIEQNGKVHPQIVEKAQIDIDNPEQKAILDQSTHFNPVDLVCFIKDYKGRKFDLYKYRDMNTSFIANKTLDGRALKALELPGLWNGAMADWITIFVEVPLSTFNPVKTVNDLLKPNHQPA